MGKWTKRLLAVMLAAMMLCSIAPLTANAAITSGNCGPDASFIFDTATGVLTITGTGEISSRWDGWDDGTEWRYPDQWDNRFVKTVTIGEGITKIGNWVFEYAERMTSISLPNSLLEIGHSAFWGCLNLPSITIPPNVTTIGARAFVECLKLATITIPKSVTSIGADRWWYTDGTEIDVVSNPFGWHVEQIILESGNIKYKMDSGALMTMDSKILVAYRSATRELDSYAVAAGVEMIAVDALNANYIRTLTIPASVTLIGDPAHLNANSIIVNANNPNYSSLDGSLYNKNRTVLYRSQRADHFVVPEGVTKVEGCSCALSARESITLPDSLVELPYAISTRNILVKTSNLNYTSVDGVLFSKDLKKLVRFPNGRWNETYTIPNGTTIIGTNAISSYHIKFIIPPSVTTLEENAIWGVESITIPREVINIGDYNFHGWTEHFFLGEDGMWFRESRRPLVYCYKDSAAHIYCVQNDLDYMVLDGNTRQSGDIEIFYDDGTYDENIQLEVTQTDIPESAFRMVDDKLNPKDSIIYEIKTLLNGQPVQPAGPVWVKIKLPAGYDSNAQIFYLNPTIGQIENMYAIIEDGYAIFKVEHFSLFALVQPSTTPEDDEPTTANKTALNAKIAEAESKANNTQYTAKSRAALQTAINNAKAVANNANATQTQVDNAVTALNNALSALENTSDYFKLWGKETTWKKTFFNWVLLIVCFGWIWMAF